MFVQAALVQCFEQDSKDELRTTLSAVISSHPAFRLTEHTSVTSGSITAVSNSTLLAIQEIYSCMDKWALQDLG